MEQVLQIVAVAGFALATPFVGIAWLFALLGQGRPTAPMMLVICGIPLAWLTLAVGLMWWAGGPRFLSVAAAFIVALVGYAAMRSLLAGRRSRPSTPVYPNPPHERDVSGRDLLAASDADHSRNAASAAAHVPDSASSSSTTK